MVPSLLQGLTGAVVQYDYDNLHDACANAKSLRWRTVLAWPATLPDMSPSSISGGIIGRQLEIRILHASIKVHMPSACHLHYE